MIDFFLILALSREFLIKSKFGRNFLTYHESFLMDCPTESKSLTMDDVCNLNPYLFDAFLKMIKDHSLKYRISFYFGLKLDHDWDTFVRYLKKILLIDLAHCLIYVQHGNILVCTLFDFLTKNEIKDLSKTIKNVSGDFRQTGDCLLSGSH